MPMLFSFFMQKFMYKQTNTEEFKVQPYYNNNYYNPYPQYQPQYQGPQGNQYTDRINNLQQYQQSLQMPQQQNTLGGKVVDSIDAVKATDIPMDGNFYYFPKADASELYAKRWLASGNTEIITYKPFLGSENQQMVNSSGEPEKAGFGVFGELTEAFMKRFDDIDSRFDKLEKSIKARNTGSRAKKESETE